MNRYFYFWISRSVRGVFCNSDETKKGAEEERRWQIRQGCTVSPLARLSPPPALRPRKGRNER